MNPDRKKSTGAGVGAALLCSGVGVGVGVPQTSHATCCQVLSSSP